MDGLVGQRIEEKKEGQGGWWWWWEKTDGMAAKKQGSMDTQLWFQIRNQKTGRSKKRVFEGGDGFSCRWVWRAKGGKKSWMTDSVRFRLECLQASTSWGERRDTRWEGPSFGNIKAGRSILRGGRGVLSKGGNHRQHPLDLVAPSHLDTSHLGVSR